jgi:soluble lytic murein transglycosylase-like protein
VLAPRASADASLDRYFALRREHQTANLQTSHVKANPDAYRGRVIELRGTLSGTTRGSEHTFFIIDSPDGCYVVSADDMPDLAAGARICVLVEVGEKSIASLSDLKLVALAYQSEVLERERRAMQAESAKKVKYSVVAKNQGPQEAGRFKRGGNPSSRSGETLEASELVAIYKKAIKSFNRRLSDAEADTIARSVLGFSAKYQVDPRLVVAMILAESSFRLEATSSEGAMGLGQLMPGTADGLGVTDPYDPVENIGGSVRLIRGHLDRLSGNAPWTELTWQDLALALASYNAGPGAVKKYGGVPPYRETRNYINKVISIYRGLCGYN